MSTVAFAISTTKTRAEIARENGAKSRGPISVEGKARSSQNSLSHSLTATQVVCTSPDDQERFNAMHESYIQIWKPGKHH